MNAFVPAPASIESSPLPFLRVPTRAGELFIQETEIYYLKAWSNYTFIYLKSGRLLSAKTLSYYQQRLSPTRFLRPHQSYCINRKYIRLIDLKRNKIELQTGEIIPLSRHRKKLLKSTLA